MTRIREEEEVSRVVIDHLIHCMVKLFSKFRYFKDVDRGMVSVYFSVSSLYYCDIGHLL